MAERILISDCLAGTKSGVPVFSQRKVRHFIAQELCESGDNSVTRKEKVLMSNIEKAKSVVESSMSEFNNVFNQLLVSEEKLSEKTKKVSGNLRDSCQKMADGLQRIQKTADFNGLERQVVLLERAADALEKLSNLQDNGKLEKILAAIK